jgi:hypothetical protein
MSLHVALRRGLTLERGIQAAIVCTVVGAVLAAGSVLPLLTFGRGARWVGLVALTVLAVAWGVRRAGLRPAPALVPAAAAAAALVVVAYASATWSATPGLTFARASSLAFVVVAAAALGTGAAGSTAGLRAVLDGVLLGVGAVALGGLVVLAVDADRAIDPATTLTPGRYQGLGGGPNTATMVLAVGAPLAVDALLGATSRVRRVLAGGLAALVLGSIVASGSRGALVAAFGGLLVYALLRERELRRRLVAAAAALAALAAAAALMRLPDPLPAGSQSRRGTIPPTVDPAPIVPRRPYADANLLLRLQDDVGHPAPGVGVEERRRSLFGSSGRAQAWQGALEEGEKRPLAGHGFGTEDKVFADRYVSFNSNVPENSYLGLFLQLGATGLVLFGALAAAIVGPVARGLAKNRVSGSEPLTPERAARRGLAAACTGGFAAGLVLAGFQSYVYAAGNNATAALWICGFLACAAVAPDASDG